MSPRPSYRVRALTGDKEKVTRQPPALGLLTITNIYVGDNIYYLRTSITCEGSYLHIAKRKVEFRGLCYSVQVSVMVVTHSLAGWLRAVSCCLLCADRGPGSGSNSL